MDLGIVGLYGLGHFFHEGRLTCLGRRYDHSSLPLSDRAQKIHDSHGYAGSRLLQTDPVIREDRRHIFKIIALCRLLRFHIIDGFDKKERSEFFSLGLDPDISSDDVPRLEIKSPDLAGRHINIIVSRKIVGTSDKTVSVRHHFQNAVSDLSAVQFARELILVNDRGIRFLLICLGHAAAVLGGELSRVFLVFFEQSFDQFRFLERGDLLHSSFLGYFFEILQCQGLVSFFCHNPPSMYGSHKTMRRLHKDSICCLVCVCIA